MDITEHIEAKGLSRARICEDAGISRGYLSLIESGARRIGVGKLRALSGALGIPPRDLRPDLMDVFDDHSGKHQEAS